MPFPRPIFACVGRVAVEKNLEAFLSLDLPGTKIVIGTGPQEAALKERFPDARFLGLIENGKLAAHLAAADVFVFPSLTDTFGVVQLEASCMQGPRRQAGAVAALEGVRTPSLVAKAVMEMTDHHLLVVKCAQTLARILGFSIDDELNTERSRMSCLEWKRRTDPGHS